MIMFTFLAVFEVNYYLFGYDERAECQKALESITAMFGDAVEIVDPEQACEITSAMTLPDQK